MLLNKVFHKMTTGLVIVAGMFVVTGCPNDSLSTVVQENSLVTLLRKDKWIVFNLPDSKLNVGSVIRFTEEEGPRFLGYLSDCGVPKEVTEPVRGQAPQLASSNSFDIGVDLSLKIVGVPVGTDAAYAKAASLIISESGADEINLIRLKMWLSNPENQLPDTCKSFFEPGGNSFVISSAYRVTSGSIEYKKEAGGSAGLSEIELGKVVDLKAKGHIKSVSDGKITFDGSDYYIAYKRIVPLDGELMFLSSPSDSGQAVLADAGIQAWLEMQ